MKSEQGACKNCERQIRSSYKFCPFCGQETKEELTVKVLFYNTIRNYFSVDARFFKSFFPLLFKPGYLARKFVEGKRLLYLHPAQMYLFVSVVFFFLFSFIQREQVESLDENLAKILNTNERPPAQTDSINAKKVSKEKTVLPERLGDTTNRKKVLNHKKFNNEPNGIMEAPIDSLNKSEDLANNDSFSFNRNKIDSLIAKGATDKDIYSAMGMPIDAGVLKKRMYSQALKFYKSKRGGGILQTFYDTIPIAMFFLLPIFALVLMIFYRKQGFYAHHLVFSFYYFALLFAVFSVVLVVNFVYDMSGWVDFIIVLSVFVYLLLALKRFYRQGWLRSFFKTCLVSVLFLCFVAPLTVIFLGVFAFLFY